MQTRDSLQARETKHSIKNAIFSMHEACNVINYDAIKRKTRSSSKYVTN